MSDTPPLTPDAPTARRWLQDELAKREYQRHESWARRLARWLSEHLSGFDVHVGGGTIPGSTVAIVVLVLVVVVAAVSLSRFRPTRKASVTSSGSAAAVFDGEPLDASEYLRRVDAAGPDMRVALMEAFRAMAARAHERHLVVLDAQTTVADLVTGLSPYLRAFDVTRPAETEERLVRAGRVFERVRYGGFDATDDDVRLVLALEQQLRGVSAKDDDRGPDDGTPGASPAPGTPGGTS